MAAPGIAQEKRLQWLLDCLARTGRLRAHQAAAKLKVSDMTIRRDLAFLESQSKVLLCRGGAVRADRLTFEFTFQNRIRQNTDLKRRIANRALDFIKNNQVVFLDTGTTCLEIARTLTGRRKITVITTSLAVVSQLQFDSKIDIILLGGFLRNMSPDLHGPLTEHNLEMFRVDLAFAGADAIDSAGATYTNDLRIVNLDRKVAHISRKVIVAADSSKFGKTALCRVFDAKDYHLLLTDNAADRKIAAKIKKKGLELILA